MNEKANIRSGLRSIAILGGGPVARVAALAFARALPGATVTMIATPTDPAALADRFPAASPAACALLASLGLDEDVLLAAGATHRVGDRFDWTGGRFALGLGEGVPVVAGTAAHQLWLAQGAHGRFDALVPAAALAEAERMVRADADPRSLLARTDHALRLDPLRLQALLSARMVAARVTTLGAVDVAIERYDDHVTALVPGDGTRVIADLFVDASGHAARLARPDAERTDWSDTLPVDRLLLTNGAARPSPADSYAATAIGWTAAWPLADRTPTALGYTAAATNDARALRQFGKPAAAVERLALRPGRRVRPFAGNVLALGDAAVMAGPLGWPDFSLACAHIALALQLMPARDPEPALAAEYNRRATLAADRVCDYHAAFYLAAAPRAGEFWHPLRTRALPDGLAAALAQFRQRGTLPAVEEEMVSRSYWTQALIGLGVRPVRSDPIARSVPTATAITELERLRSAVAALPDRLPPYPEYLMALRGRR